jgi:hypothetical protein
MIPVSQKRTVMGLSLVLLLAPSVPTKAHNDTAGNIAAGCLIGAGILGLCGIAAGIAYACSKSDEQVADDAKQLLRDFRHNPLWRFHTEYMNVFERAYYGTPGLDDIERNFLAVVANRAYYELNLSMESYISDLKDQVALLEKSLSDVKDRMRNLEAKRETYTAIYDRLSNLRRGLEDELSRFKPYYQRFADHRAYFALYAFESELYDVYKREFEIGRQYQYDPYFLEYNLLRAAVAHDLSREYPLIKYHNRLSEHIETLERKLRDLKYYYPTRTPDAQKLLDYVIYMRGVIANSSAYKEERHRKKEDDARQELLALRRREAEAAEREAAAHQMRAVAEMQRACAEQARLAQQPTVVVVDRYY